MLDFLRHPPKEILSIIGLCFDIVGFLFLGIEIVANDKFFELYDRDEMKIAEGKRKDNQAIDRLIFHTNRFFSTIIFFVAITLIFCKFSNGFDKIGVLVSSLIIFVPSFMLFNFISNRNHNWLSKSAATKPLYYLAELLYTLCLFISIIILIVPEKIISPILLLLYSKARKIHSHERNSYFKKTSFYGILLVVLGFVIQATYYYL